MIISLHETFHALWTLRGHSELATYEVQIYIEGPERGMMSDVAPILEEIKMLENGYLSKIIGKSSLEAVALYIRDFVNRHLEKCDKIVKIILRENDHFSAILNENAILSSPASK